MSLDFSGAPGSLDTGAVDVLDKDTGAVSPVSLAPAGGDTATLEVTLVPGDVIFFKYRTGRRFAG